MTRLASLLDCLNAILVGLLLCAWLSFMVAQVDGRHFQRVAAENFEQFMDFRIYYAFGQIAQSPQRVHLYDIETQNIYARKLNPGSTSQFQDYLPYPPFFAFLAVPISKLPLHVAYLTSTLAMLALACLALRRLARQARTVEDKILAVIILSTLAAWPSRHCFIAGQIGWLLVAIAAFYFVALLGRRELPSAFWLALCAVKPQLCLFLGMSALGQRRVGTLASAGAIVVALMAASLALLGWPAIESFFATMQTAAGTNVLDRAFRPEGMACLRAFFLLLFAPKVAQMLSYVCAAIALVLLGALWSAARSGSLASQRWAVAVTILTYVVAAPHVHVYDTVLVVIAAVVTLDHLSLRQSLDSQPPLKALWQILLLIYPVLSCWLYLAFPFGGTMPSFNFILLGLNSVLLLLAVKMFHLSLSSASGFEPEQ